MRKFTTGYQCNRYEAFFFGLATKSDESLCSNFNATTLTPCLLTQNKTRKRVGLCVMSLMKLN